MVFQYVGDDPRAFGHATLRGDGDAVLAFLRSQSPEQSQYICYLRLILEDVVKGLGGHRDTLFTSIFWQRLHTLIGTELRLSSAYHQQTDGATERANRTMTQMLRQCVELSQKKLGVAFTWNRICNEFGPIRYNGLLAVLLELWTAA
jgi:hypothetical protein